MAAATIPGVLLALFAGVIIDRMNGNNHCFFIDTFIEFVHDDEFIHNGVPYGNWKFIILANRTSFRTAAGRTG